MPGTVLALGVLSVTRVDGLYPPGHFGSGSGCVDLSNTHDHVVILGNNCSGGKVIASWVCAIKEQ